MRTEDVIRLFGGMEDGPVAPLTRDTGYPDVIEGRDARVNYPGGSMTKGELQEALSSARPGYGMVGGGRNRNRRTNRKTRTRTRRQKQVHVRKKHLSTLRRK